MLELKNIYKNYAVGTGEVKALRGINTIFRKCEFVSILGPSGCGKTTLLNIIGGLDGYTEGDLVIGGRSTKDFRDSDWDAYRNHSIGFVFQSYNLIPHQSVLANVELSLTISGISRAARRARAKEVLCRVGLESEMYKKPSQMSGGQMQRVAIARALVNNPEILLADEPTGALDSETSVQIMELLREVARDRLVIMVTHNPRLAEEYSTRILKMLDGKITDDSAPCTAEEAAAELPQEKEEASAPKKKGKRLKNRSMSFFTALTLSLNNLRTKKGRTFLTGFAGSIGIIGIALILAVSQGVEGYIARVQEDTLTGFPIILQAESVDMGGLVNAMMSARRDENNLSHERDAVYANRVMYDLINSLSKVNVQRNNLTAFKRYMESTPEFSEYLSAVRCVYDVKLPIYMKDKEGRIVSSDPSKLMQELMPQQGGSAFAAYDVWQEMLPGENGETVSELLKMQYDVIYGEFPKSYDEIILVVDERNEVSDLALYTLGLKTTEEVRKEFADAISGKLEESKVEKFTYEELCGMEFKLILAPTLYRKSGDGYTNLAENEAGLSLLYSSEEPVTLRISGILRPNEDAASPMLNGAIGYTAALTDYAIEKAAESEIVKEQLAHPAIDVLTGLPFRGETEESFTDSEKAERVKTYFAGLSAAEKAAIYTSIQKKMPEDAANAAAGQFMADMTPEAMVDMAVAAYAERMGVTDTEEIRRYIENMKPEELSAMVLAGVKEKIMADYAAKTEETLGAMPAASLAAFLDSASYTEAEYAALFDEYMPATSSEATLEQNLKALGYVDVDSPSAINLYASSFKNKDGIAELIESYNKGVSEEDKITYTDYVKILLSSITTIISAISYVLIAFVAISLVVSSIMIGIITYISVLERTKEIGILRAIGASKRDVSRVFNAETTIVGFLSGALGIGVTLLLLLPINMILRALTGIRSLGAVLPVEGAIVLVCISILLTLVAGLIPAKMAAKKDPVIALRTE